MMDVDHPRADSTWPGCQGALEEMIGHLPADVIADICHGSAAVLFGHPLPVETLPWRAIRPSLLKACRQLSSGVMEFLL